MENVCWQAAARRIPKAWCCKSNQIHISIRKKKDEQRAANRRRYRVAIELWRYTEEHDHLEIYALQS